jgi:thiosulfate reductase cytochrome b subunit
LRRIGPSIAEHVRLEHPTGAAAARYNVLQRLAYLGVIFVLLPFLVLMGLGMSPALDTIWPGWIEWLGGRQSVRTLHFIAASLVVAFTLVHVFEVVITGAWNNLRSMITGKYRLPPEEGR